MFRSILRIESLIQQFYKFYSFHPDVHRIVDDLGRAVEELVTVITEQEIETTIEAAASNHANDTSADDASNSNSRPLKE